MAIQSVLTNEKLAIRVQSGQDAQGKKIYKDVTFNHLKTPANPADVYAVAEELRKVMIQLLCNRSLFISQWRTIEGR